MLTKLGEPFDTVVLAAFLLPAICGMCLFPSGRLSADTPMENGGIKYLSSESFFADREIEVRLRALNMKNCVWSLTYLSKTVVNGTAAVSPKGETVIRLKFPAIQPDVVATANLSCLFDERHEFTRLINFFYRNPFRSRARFFKKRKVGILSEDRNSPLVSLCTQLQIPCRTVNDPTTFDGSILVNYNTSEYDWNKIYQTMDTLSKRSVRIILIKPDVGDFHLGEFKKIDRYQFAGCDFIHSFNKKYDTELWDNQTFCEGSFKSVSDGEDLTLQVSEELGFFSFFRMKKGKAEIIVTSWDLVKFGDKSPTAVCLLKDLFLK